MNNNIKKLTEDETFTLYWVSAQVAACSDRLPSQNRLEELPIISREIAAMWKDLNPGDVWTMEDLEDFIEKTLNEKYNFFPKGES